MSGSNNLNRFPGPTLQMKKVWHLSHLTQGGNIQVKINSQSQGDVSVPGEVGTGHHAAYNTSPVKVDFFRCLCPWGYKGRILTTVTYNDDNN